MSQEESDLLLNIRKNDIIIKMYINIDKEKNSYIFAFIKNQNNNIIEKSSIYPHELYLKLISIMGKIKLDQIWNSLSNEIISKIKS